MSKSMLMTIGATLVVLAMVYRIPEAKEALTGESGGVFSWF